MFSPQRRAAIVGVYTTEQAMHEFGATNEDLAEVAVTHRYHATLNPDSIMGRRDPITVEDVVGSRMIADPLHLLDCALDNDGGYAIVIAAEDVARDCRKTPVWGSHCTHPSGMHTIEVVRQLRGECGERQVPDARIGISLAQGVAVHGQAGPLIMARD
jgi:acetyl-CoA acetyltransferase